MADYQRFNVKCGTCGGLHTIYKRNKPHGDVDCVDCKDNKNRILQRRYSKKYRATSLTF